MSIPETAISDWLAVTQEQVDLFADATGDHQWIHVDPARAESESMYGATVAHGFLTLSLLPVLLRQAVPLDDVRMSVNYGLNRVRFITPVTVGLRIRARFDASSVEENGDSTRVVWSVTIESEDSEKPCCVAEWIVVY